MGGKHDGFLGSIETSPRYMWKLETEEETEKRGKARKKNIKQNRIEIEIQSCSGLINIIKSLNFS